MASRKSNGKASQKKDYAKKQMQRLEKRGAATASRSACVGSLEIRPRVDDSEPNEDAAVFNKDYRLKLSEELRGEAESVYESLELTVKGQFEEALGAVKQIARNSPFSDWRLFIRGLHAFYSGDVDSARQNWTKLDRVRRPARIAATLFLAELGQPLDSESLPVPDSLAEHAKNLRLRKSAVEAAQAIAKVRHRDPDVSLSVSQVAMLTSLIETYRKLDPEFVTRVGQACMSMAINQGDMEIFDRLTKIVPGSLDDPKWNRARMVYLLEFDGAEEQFEDAATAYLESDLPKLTHLSAQLRNALACKIHLLRAEVMGEDHEDTTFSFSFSARGIELSDIHDVFRKAIQQYPTYRLAHQKLIGSLEAQLQGRNLNKEKEGEVEKQLRIAKEELVHAIPDEVAISLELIDLYLDEDELEKAKALVQKLSGQRLEDPRAKALPWKLKLREAMRLSRRKVDLILADKTLEEAEAIWPVWLNKNWLPFLKAALALRSGDQSQFTQMITSARQEQRLSDFVGDVMTFAALQQMNIPSPELKAFRTVVESRIEKADEMDLDNLFAVGSFFWDLARTGLKHKGYRLQSAKLGRAFADKTKNCDNSNLSAIQMDAFCWGAHHRYWPLGNEYLPTPWATKIAMNAPRLAAVLLDWVLEMKHFPSRSFSDYEPLISVVKEVARSEKDAFYRFQFDRVLLGASDALARIAAEEEQRNASRSRAFYDDDDDDYDDEDDDDDDDDENDFFDEDNDSDSECDCASCRAKRAKRARLAGVRVSADDEVAQSAWGPQEKEELSRLPPIVARVFLKLGPEGMVKLHQILDATGNDPTPTKFITGISKLLANHAMTPKEVAEFVMSFLQTMEKGASFYLDEPDDSGPNAQTVPEMAAQERKTSRKQREKELENRKRQASQSRSRR